MTKKEIDIEIGGRLKKLIDEWNKRLRKDGSGEKMNKTILSERLGIDQSQFSRILKGEAGLSVDHFLDLSSNWGVDLNWLITGKEKSDPWTGPDSLLTQLRAEINVLRASLLRLADLVPSVQEENSGQEVAYENSSSGKSQ